LWNAWAGVPGRFGRKGVIPFKRGNKEGNKSHGTKVLLSLPEINLQEVQKYFEKYGLMERYYDIVGEKQKNKDINLEADLLLSKKDFAAMRKKPFEKEQNLEDYFDFLEEIGAFESKKVKTKFYDAEFEL